MQLLLSSFKRVAGVVSVFYHTLSLLPLLIHSERKYNFFLKLKLCAASFDILLSTFSSALSLNFWIKSIIENCFAIYVLIEVPSYLNISKLIGLLVQMPACVFAYYITSCMLARIKSSLLQWSWNYKPDFKLHLFLSSAKLTLHICKNTDF